MREEAPQGFDEQADTLQQSGNHEDLPTEVGTETSPEATDGAAAPPRRRRRRRGGRGRGRGRGGTPRPTDGQAAVAGDGADADDGDDGAIVDSADTDGASSDVDGDGESTTGSGDAGAPAKRRRRRRGGRGRGRSRRGPAGGESPASGTGEGGAESVPASDAEGGDGEATAGAARTRRRRSRPKGDGARPAAAATTGSTRLARGRRSRGRVAGGGRRRREPLPVLPRVTDKVMVITEHGERDQIAVLEGSELVQHFVTRSGARSMVGNVYLGRVQNVLPGMEAAFVDVGRGRNAVLYAGEVNWSAEDLEGPSQRIEQVLKPGQSVLVQVTKDPIGGKGARLTAQVSLPGRFLVLAPRSNVTGISRRLPEAERKRLKGLLKSLRPESHGLIVRTAAEGASEEDLRHDVDRLVETWEDIEKRSKKAKAPSTLYEEPELTVRVVRDLFTDEEFRILVTDSRRIHELVTGYLRDVAPDLVEKVVLHEGALSAFEEYHVVEQIHKALDRKVWLPSGGYLIIERTEALTVIDVNTGKSVGKTNLEETVVNTNLEAAREVARQLRLRDIGGMIVIDFIDMLLEQNKRKVVETVAEALAMDKTRSQVFDISPLGLLEVTRKRVSGGLLEAFSETCPTCEGRGHLLTYDVK